MGFCSLALVAALYAECCSSMRKKKTEPECYTDLVSEIVEMGIVDAVATAAAAGVARRGLQYLQMVIGKVDPHTVRGLPVEVVGAGRVRRQSVPGT